MKHFLWCLLLLCHSVLAQTGAQQKEDDYSDIAGNPYLFKDWSNGIVKFSSGRVMNQFRLKFDCLKNMLLLEFGGSTFAAESKVQEFIMYPKSGKTKDSLIFRKGFPPTDKTTDATYFQLLFQGKVALLRLFSRNIIEEKQMVVSSGRPMRRMENTEYFYLYQNGALVLLPADKNELPDIFGPKKDEMAQFIASQTLKMHNVDDFVEVVKKYNELLQ